MNTKYDNHFSPRGDPISYDSFSVDSFVGHPHLELEGDLNVSPNFSNEYVSPLPDPEPNINPEGATRRRYFSRGGCYAKTTSPLSDKSMS